LKRIPKKLPTLKDRRSGLLLHLSSLPGPYYCGDLGKAAYRFADFLAAAGQSWWQMLPVNPIGLGNSPYSTTCSFAGDPLYIDLEGLVEDGLLKKSEIAKPQAPSPGRIYYQKARRYREVRLKTAYARFTAGEGNIESAQFTRFFARHKYWLEDFALFCVLAKKFKTRNWRNWPRDLRRRKPSALSEIQAAYQPELNYIKFLQFKLCHDYMGGAQKSVHWAMIREAMKSVANLAIFPIQDILGLNSKARMNIPGTASGNWQWRMAENALSNKLAAKLSHETQTFNRLL
jgi:4-alpha-glucanotransferase